MANSKLIQNAKTEKLPLFPELSVGKTRRTMTKHYTNLSLWLPQDELQILNFLVYETLSDNTFIYSTFLLERYLSAVKVANMQYCGVSVYKSESDTRRCIHQLIRKGCLLQTGIKNRIMVNPCLTYNLDCVNAKKYKSVCEKYQVSSAEKVTEFTSYYINLVATFLESKKPNYKYGKRKV